MQELAGRNAVVVGGGQGIGRGIALALAREGTDVAVLDIESDAAQRTAEEVAAIGVRSIGIRADVTHPDSLAAAARDVTHALGPVHVLSNNAGVVLPQGPITGATPAEWEWVFSVNVFGIVQCVQTFLPGMLAHGRGGHIVNTSSAAGLVAIPELEVGVYTASKYACNGYSEILRGELADRGIGVSVLCPGLIATDLSRTSARNRPARFGGPAPEPPPMPDEMKGQAMAPEDVGPIVVRGIKANRGTILTHPELVVPMTEARMAAIRADGEAEQEERG